jgi:hypothetical protein
MMTLLSRIKAKLTLAAPTRADRSPDADGYDWRLDPRRRRELEQELLTRELRWRTLC